MSATVVVTGAARGIGAAIAERHAGAGWSTILVDRDASVEETAAALRSRHGDGCRGVVADLTDAAGRAEVERAVGDSDAPLRGLVNNAGITRDALATKMTTDDFQQVVRVNLGAAWELTTALVPRLAEGGSIVNLSSKSANGNAGQFNYAVSKAGLIGLTRSLALRLAPRVRVNAVAPAFISTPMTAAIPDELRTKFISSIPFGRPGEPDEVADVVHWLTSDRSAYVTGQVLSVCGGRSFGQ
jgi:NAD(P)-dependent dehydrogenase (short-subunit alcohol dehydrogenase family)